MTVVNSRFDHLKGFQHDDQGNIEYSQIERYRFGSWLGNIAGDYCSYRWSDVSIALSG